MSHLGRLRRFPLKTIGGRNWVQKLLDKQQAPNQPNQRPQIQFVEQGDLLRQNKRPARVLRKSTHVSYLIAKASMCAVERSDKDKDADENVVERGDPLEMNNLSICSHNVRK